MNTQIFEELANAVLAIKSDEQLKQALLTVLAPGSFSQQVRVAKILEAIKKLDPPKEVVRLLSLLQDDKIANLVYQELMK